MFRSSVRNGIGESLKRSVLKGTGVYFVVMVLSLLVDIEGGTVSSARWNQFEYFGYFSNLLAKFKHSLDLLSDNFSISSKSVDWL